jgi:hypothetical protein
MKKKKLPKDKITKEHFELFKKYCLEHINKLGLLGWKIYFDFKHIDDFYASCNVNLGGRIALITLSTHWDFARELNQETLKETAKHEVHHLLLFRFSKLAKYRFIRNDELEEAEEEIIRILDKML